MYTVVHGSRAFVTLPHLLEAYRSFYILGKNYDHVLCIVFFVFFFFDVNLVIQLGFLCFNVLPFWIFLDFEILRFFVLVVLDSRNPRIVGI